MDLTHGWPTPLLIISETSSVPIGQSLEGQTESGSSPSPATGHLSSRSVACARDPGTMPMSIARQAGIKHCGASSRVTSTG